MLAESPKVPTSRKRRYTFINRTPKENVTPISSLYVSLESVQRVSSVDYCQNKCCELADRNMVVRIRQDFWGQSQEVRTNYVYDVLCVSWLQDSKTHKIKYEFKLNGMVVCCRSWYEVHGIPKTSFYRYREKFEAGVRQHVHGNTGIVRRSLEHTGMARALLEDFVNVNSE